jgi:hypothetical protein
MKTAAAFVSYLLLWSVALACYWAGGAGSTVHAFSLLSLRVLLPLGALAVSCAAGAAGDWRVRKTVLLAVFGALYFAALELTHGLSGAHAHADFSRGAEAFLVGAVFAATGLAAGAIAHRRYGRLEA